MQPVSLVTTCQIRPDGLYMIPWTQSDAPITCLVFGQDRKVDFLQYFFYHGCDLLEDAVWNGNTRASRKQKRYLCTGGHDNTAHPSTLKPQYRPSVLTPATCSEFGLFMLPFWAAGALVAKHVLVDPFVTSKLMIEQHKWSLKSVFGGENGITLNEIEGATNDLRGAWLELIAIVDGMPQYDIKLYGLTGATCLPIGIQVSEEELHYIVDQINDHIQKLHDMHEMLDPLSTS
jgi:hypothetical protein